jgi:hypothetical protein
MKILNLFALCLLASAASAQTTPSDDASTPSRMKKPYVPIYGVNVGYEYLLSSRTREFFGDGGISVAPAFGPTFAKKGLLLLPGFSFFMTEKDMLGDTNRAIVASIGPSFRYGFGQPATVEIVDGEPKVRFRTFVPYVQVGLNLVYTHLEFGAIDHKEAGFSYGGSVAVGTSITPHAFIQARARLMPTFKTYDFSTIGLEFGVRF